MMPSLTSARQQVITPMHDGAKCAYPGCRGQQESNDEDNQSCYRLCLDWLRWCGKIFKISQCRECIGISARPPLDKRANEICGLSVQHHINRTALLNASLCLQLSLLEYLRKL